MGGACHGRRADRFVGLFVGLDHRLERIAWNRSQVLVAGGLVPSDAYFSKSWRTLYLSFWTTGRILKRLAPRRQFRLRQFLAHAPADIVADSYAIISRANCIKTVPHCPVTLS